MLQNFIKKRTFETVLYEWELYKKQYTSKYDVIDKFPRRIFLIHVFFLYFHDVKIAQVMYYFSYVKIQNKNFWERGCWGKYIKVTVYEIWTKLLVILKLNKE